MTIKMNILVIAFIYIQFQCSFSKFVPIVINTWNFDSATKRGPYHL